MVKITYIEYSGVRHEVDLAPGGSVMEGAISNNIPGIDAECGGACACATCHVYVDENWLKVTGEPSDMEKAMLDFAEGAASNSRLSCQLTITEEYDGLIVRMPETQG